MSDQARSGAELAAELERLRARVAELEGGSPEATAGASRPGEASREQEQIIDRLSREVEQRRQAEQALRSQLHLLQTLLDAIPHPVYYKDTAGRYLGCNAAFAAGVGLPIERLVGRTVHDVASGELAEVFARKDAELLADRGVQVYEFPKPAPDGTLRDVVFHKATFNDADGHLAGLVGTLVDVTDRKRAEQELRLSEAKNRALLSAMPDMIFRIGREGTYREFVGAEGGPPIIPPNRFLGKTVREVFPPAFAEQVMGVIERAFATHEVQGLEYRFPLSTSDGQERIYELRMVVSGPDEVMAIVRNVTDRVRIERDLRESVATNRAILQAIPDELVHLNRDGVYLTVLPTRRHETSLDSAKSVGRKLWDVLPGELADRLHQAIRRALEIGLVETVEYDVMLRRGRQRFREARVVAASEDRALVVVRDITDRKRSEKAERAYREQLRTLASELSLTEERERRRIAAELHDHVGQTLALAKIRLGSLRDPSLPAHLAGPLDEVYALVEQTIADTRSLTFRLSPPVLHELGFEPAAEWLAEQIGRQYNIAVQVESSRQSKPMDDDVRIVLFGALRELLVNAAKHSGARLVKVRIRRRAGNIRIGVTDEGVGFKPGQAERAPNPDASGLGTPVNGEGGFGLFSLRERLGHLGGSLRVRSSPGRGAEVALVAPLKRTVKARDTHDEHSDPDR